MEMAEDVETSTNAGMGFFSWLLLLFIALKLTHVIEWRWRWVLAPLWAPLVMVAGGVLCAVVVVVISDVIGAKK